MGLRDIPDGYPSPTDIPEIDPNPTDIPEADPSPADTPEAIPALLTLEGPVAGSPSVMLGREGEV